MTEQNIQEDQIVAKVIGRLVPFLFLCYIVNYLDRFNVSFAAMDLKADLAMGDKAYGLGVGIFFIGYVFFEVPSNLMLQKFGARVWIARIMVTWGIISSCMMLIKSIPGFYTLRLLLGVAEAGFFPGIIFYLSHWIPKREQAKVFAMFLTSTALAGVIGGPVSGAILKMSGVGGLRGWQWLFLLEGIPAVIMGLVTLGYLTDRPEQAQWLNPAEREWLSREMRAENDAKQARHGMTLLQALTHGTVWELGVLYFSIIISFYGVSFWLPQIIKNLSGLSNSMADTVSAGPYLAASIGMVLVGRHSDRTGERRWHVALSAWAGCAGLLASAAFQQSQPWLAYAALCLAATGIWSTLGAFWSMPTAFLTGTAAAGGIALINSMGSVGGLGPIMIGYIKEKTQSFEAGLLVLAATLLIAGFIALSVREAQREKL